MANLRLNFFSAVEPPPPRFEGVVIAATVVEVGDEPVRLLVADRARLTEVKDEQ